MGAFLGKAQILSANKIKHGKNIYTLRQNASKEQNINPYFIGRWENMSSYNKSEMSEIFFVIKNAKLTVDILFSCPPTDCGWGKGKVLAIENAGKTIKLIYDSSFSGVTKLLNIHLADKKLTIETTIRHDDSRKKDIITQNFLRKVPLLTSAQIRAKRLAEWYKAHPEQRPKK